MQPEQLLENLTKQLPHLKPSTINFVLSYLNYYMSKCRESNTKCTTKNIVKDLPQSLVGMYGKLADIVCLQHHVNNYKLFADVVDELVSLDILSYSPEDSLKDFDIPNDFLFDVRTRLSDYIEYVDKRLNG